MQVYYKLLSHYYENIIITSIEESNFPIIITAHLKDIRGVCSKCNSSIIHINESKSRIIRDIPYNDKDVSIKLSYKRYKCYACNHKFTQSQDIVSTNHKFSNNAIIYCKNQFHKMLSGVDIAKDTSISTTTVWRYFAEIDIKVNLDNVTGLSIDEFKGNAGNDKYQLPILNQDKELLATLDSRRAKTIQEFFDKLDKTKIEFVVSDLFKSFRAILKRNFPKAKLIADPYHYYRQFSWSIRDKRIALYNSSDERYKEYKKYWKLFVRNPLKLTIKQKERLQLLLSNNLELEKMHECYKRFYEIHQIKGDELEEEYNELLADILKIGCEESKKLHATLKSWREEIINAIRTKKSNGVLEGFNNKTKVIKRVSYGIRKHKTYDKLMHLRLRSSAEIIKAV